MRYGIRSLLILFAIAAISSLLLRNYFVISTYEPLDYVSIPGRLKSFKGPYINCITAHEPNWGKVRMVFLEKVKTKKDWEKHRFLDWVQIKDKQGSPSLFYVNRKLVRPSDSVLVYYSDGDSQPQVAEVNLSDLSLVVEPYLINPDKLWNKLHPKEKSSELAR
jgi:hypothetical protein